MTDNLSADIKRMEEIDQKLRTLTETFIQQSLLQPHQAFGKFIDNLIPLDASDDIRIASIQRGLIIYNETVKSLTVNNSSLADRQIALFYHFTDTPGAEAVQASRALGKEKIRTYVTLITPQLAKPLSSAEDAKEFEKYFRDRQIPQTFREHAHRFILGLKFKWLHDVKARFANSKLGKNVFHTKTIIPVGAHKLEHVFITAIGQNDSQSVLQTDKHGERYVNKPIKLNDDPHFRVFGPLKTPGVNPNLARTSQGI